MSEEKNNLEKFKQEFRLTSELSHPGIVEVYDFGYTREKKAFYTMELVEGEELSPEAAQPDLDRFYKLVWQISDILEYFHSQNLIHADLKPSNFKLTPGIFSVKILDFGMVRTSSCQTSDQVEGTPDYMAPEVWLGKKIDQRADLYSLGVILFELLPSKLPFTSEDPLVLRSNHLEKIPPPPSAFRAGLSEELDSLVLKLLQKKPEDRFQNISELKEKFSRIATFPLWGAEKTSYINQLYGGKILAREKEFQILQKELKESLSNAGRMFIIEGELGIGKSTLLNYLKKESQLEGNLFVQIDCPEEETYPLQPLKELFRKIWPFFQQLFPPLCQKYEEDFKLFLTATPDQENQGSLKLDKLSSFLFEASNLFPFVLAFEDLHWLGEGSFSFLEELTRTLDGSRLFLVGTLEENDLDPQGRLKSLINRLTGTSQLLFLRLPSLTLKELEELLSRKLAEKTIAKALLDFIYHNSSGVPLFALEILKYLFEKKVLYFEKGSLRLEKKLLAELEIPDNIEKTILGNLKRYPERILSFLNLAALVGKEFDLKSIKFLTGYDEEKIFETLFVLLKDRILIQTQKKPSFLVYNFASPVLQSLIYKNFNTGKELLHRKLAYHLEERKSQGEEIETETVAHHFILSDDYKKAFEYSFNCAVKNQKDLDYPQALKYLNKTLETAEKFPEEKEREKRISQTLMQKGNLLKNIGELKQAQKDYEEILKIAGPSEDKRLIAETYKDLGDLFRLKHDFQNGLACLVKAREIFQDLKDFEEIAHTLNNIGNTYWINSQYQEALKAFGEALEIQRTLDSKPDIASTLNNMGSIYVSQHQYKKALEYHTKSLQIKKELGNKEEIARSLNNIGFVYYLMGSLQNAIRSYMESLELNQEIENKKEITINTVNLSECYFKLGEYEKATSYANMGLEMARNIDFLLPVGYLLKSLANIDFETGFYQRALELLKESLTLSEKMEDKELRVSVFISLGRLFFLLNRSEDADRFIEKGLEISRVINDKRTQITVGRLKGILLRKKRRVAEALKLLENSLELAEELNSLEDKLNLNLDFAWLYLSSNQYQMFEKFLEKAKKIIDQSSFPLIEPEYYFLLFRKEIENGNLNQAHKYSEIALKKASKLSKLELVWRIHYLTGKLNFLKNDFENAYKEYEKAGKLIKSLSQNIEDPELKQSYVSEEEKLNLITDIRKLAQVMVGK
ncbi:MAG: tetratricopeptide repeat protein [candidate division Zixibacteria bacterium]|nr:tetratricopeptide repeat protein [candidate division Zixibacteria bacterium]